MQPMHYEREWISVICCLSSVRTYPYLISDNWGRIRFRAVSDTDATINATSHRSSLTMPFIREMAFGPESNSHSGQTRPLSPMLPMGQRYAVRKPKVRRPGLFTQLGLTSWLKIRQKERKDIRKVMHSLTDPVKEIMVKVCIWFSWVLLELQ